MSSNLHFQRHLLWCIVISYASSTWAWMENLLSVLVFVPSSWKQASKIPVFTYRWASIKWQHLHRFKMLLISREFSHLCKNSRHSSTYALRREGVSELKFRHMKNHISCHLCGRAPTRQPHLVWTGFVCVKQKRNSIKGNLKPATFQAFFVM